MLGRDGKGKDGDKDVTSPPRLNGARGCWWQGCRDPIPNKRQRQSRTPQTGLAANPRLARDAMHVSPHASIFLIGTASLLALPSPAPQLVQLPPLN